MSLIFSNPFNTFQPSFNFFDDLAIFDNDMIPFRGSSNSASFQAPPIDVHEREKSYKVQVSLPGVLPKDLQVDFDASKYELRIKAETSSKKESQNTENGKQLISERYSGRFERRIVFPRKYKIDDAQIKASLNNGVLTLRIPKVVAEAAPEPSRRTITVEQEDSDAATPKLIEESSSAKEAPEKAADGKEKL